MREAQRGKAIIFERAEQDRVVDERDGEDIAYPKCVNRDTIAPTT
jgi:hypothetical protein